MNRCSFLLGTAAIQLVMATKDGPELHAQQVAHKYTSFALGTCDTCGLTWKRSDLRHSGKLLVCDRGYCKALAASFGQTKGFKEMLNDARMDLSIHKWVEADAAAAVLDLATA